MPLAIEQLDVCPYDMVISSSYIAAKGVMTRPISSTSATATPPPVSPGKCKRYLAAKTGLCSAWPIRLRPPHLHYIRNWDVRSSHGVDVFITNSDFVGRRIQKLYRRQPPPSIRRWIPIASTSASKKKITMSPPPAWSRTSGLI